MLQTKVMDLEENKSAHIPGNTMGGGPDCNRRTLWLKLCGTWSRREARSEIKLPSNLWNANVELKKSNHDQLPMVEECARVLCEEMG